jgi:hypothetical protein
LLRGSKLTPGAGRTSSTGTMMSPGGASIGWQARDEPRVRRSSGHGRRQAVECELPDGSTASWRRIVRRQLRKLGQLTTPIGRHNGWLSARNRLASQLQDIAALHRRSLGRRVRIVTVVGSFGKTNAAAALCAVLGLPSPPSNRNAGGSVALTDALPASVATSCRVRGGAQRTGSDGLDRRPPAPGPGRRDVDW